MVLGIFQDKPGGPGRRQQTLTDSEDEAESGDGAGEDGTPLAGWVYVGSHNFTPSAWGTLSGSGFNPTLNVSARVVVTCGRCATADFYDLAFVGRLRTMSWGSCFRCTARRRSTGWRAGSGHCRSMSLGETSPGYVSAASPPVPHLLVLTFFSLLDPVRISSFRGGWLRWYSSSIARLSLELPAQIAP